MIELAHLTHSNALLAIDLALLLMCVPDLLIVRSVLGISLLESVSSFEIHVVVCKEHVA
jgi:hypothetical protein